MVDLTVLDIIDSELTDGFNFKRIDPLRSNIDDSVKPVRSLVVTWILETRSYFAFSFETAYLAVMYFDQYSTKKTINTENLREVRLLSIACFSLATKLIECVYMPLTRFPDGDYALDFEMRLDMEKIVMDVLGWRTHYTTPFCFLPFFISELCEPSIAPATYQLLPVESVTPFISAFMKETYLIEIRPSTVAVAAIFMALGETISSKTELENRMSDVSFKHRVDIEDIFQCYTIMSHGKRHSIDFDGSTSSAPKRRRLDYRNDDYSPPPGLRMP